MGLTSLLKRLRTPYKVSQLVLTPSYKRGEYDSHAIDCPFVFAHDGRFYMTHIGWDSVGYRTGLASSDDLVHWHKEGMIIDRGPAGSATAFNAALTWIVRDNALFGDGRLKKVNGRYLGTYHAYPEAGYESGSAAIGLCWSDDLRRWELEPMCLHCDDPGAGAWERGGLYKSCLLELDGVFYLFYNAKNHMNWPWMEQTGVAISTDLKQWHRVAQQPVLAVGAPGTYDDLFASDPCVLRCDDTWALFYLGNSSDGHARDSVAFSTDLLHWDKCGEVLVDVGPTGAIDSRHAHKPSMFFHAGRLYHFYCAVAPAASTRLGEIDHDEIRGIAVSTNA